MNHMATSIDILNNVFVYKHAATCIMHIPWHRKKERIISNYHKITTDSTESLCRQ